MTIELTIADGAGKVPPRGWVLLEKGEEWIPQLTITGTKGVQGTITARRRKVGLLSRGWEDVAVPDDRLAGSTDKVERRLAAQQVPSFGFLELEVCVAIDGKQNPVRERVFLDERRYRLTLLSTSFALAVAVAVWRRSILQDFKWGFLDALGQLGIGVGSVGVLHGVGSLLAAGRAALEGILQKERGPVNWPFFLLGRWPVVLAFVVLLVPAVAIPPRLTEVHNGTRRKVQLVDLGELGPGQTRFVSTAELRGRKPAIREDEKAFCWVGDSDCDSLPQRSWMDPPLQEVRCKNHFWASEDGKVVLPLVRAEDSCQPADVQKPFKLPGDLWERDAGANAPPVFLHPKPFAEAATFAYGGSTLRCEAGAGAMLVLAQASIPEAQSLTLSCDSDGATYKATYKASASVSATPIVCFPKAPQSCRIEVESKAAAAHWMLPSALASKSRIRIGLAANETVDLSCLGVKNPVHIVLATISAGGIKKITRGKCSVGTDVGNALTGTVPIAWEDGSPDSWELTVDEDARPGLSLNLNGNHLSGHVTISGGAPGTATCPAGGASILELVDREEGLTKVASFQLSTSTDAASAADAGAPESVGFEDTSGRRAQRTGAWFCRSSDLPFTGTGYMKDGGRHVSVDVELTSNGGAKQPVLRKRRAAPGPSCYCVQDTSKHVPCPAGKAYGPVSCR